MDHTEIRRIITEVTKDLTPSRLDIDVQADVIRLVVVSEHFANFAISKRFSRLSQAFEANSETLVEEYTLIFQAWTAAELAEIETSDGENIQSSTLPRHRQAAQPADL